MSFDTPILFLGFKRPELSKRVIDSLEQVQPRFLFVVIDGPRNGVEGEKEKCDQVAQLFETLPWDCRVTKLIRETNLGCAKSVSGGISWFFEHVDKGIIIEDDCIASTDFFYFCRELLRKYESDERIFHIGGNNFQEGKKRGDGDYYFSIFNHVWGWATWKRAWDKFDFDIDPEETATFQTFVQSENIREYFKSQFTKAINGQVNSWAYRWTFACWKNRGASILPNVNLVSNIGFGDDSTHTSNIDSQQSNMAIHKLSFPLNHPENISINRNADLYTFKKVFNRRPSLISLLKFKVKRGLLRLINVSRFYRK